MMVLSVLCCGPNGIRVAFIIGRQSKRQRCDNDSRVQSEVAMHWETGATSRG